MKADLQQVVVSKEYADKKYGSTDADEAPAEDEPRQQGAGAGGIDDVKAIILDESEFWSRVVEILRVCVPIIKLLRLCDNQAKEVMGKIYYNMFKIGQQMEEQTTIEWWNGSRRRRRSTVSDGSTSTGQCMQLGTH